LRRWSLPWWFRICSLYFFLEPCILLCREPSFVSCYWVLWFSSSCSVYDVTTVSYQKTEKKRIQKEIVIHVVRW
jgi:hypothetical protein